MILGVAADNAGKLEPRLMQEAALARPSGRSFTKSMY